MSLEFVLISTLMIGMLSQARKSFNVRSHLSSKVTPIFLRPWLSYDIGNVPAHDDPVPQTSYAWKVPIPGAPSIHDTPDPKGYEPIHIWLLARHGTRWPTKGRMQQINTLEALFQVRKDEERHSAATEQHMLRADRQPGRPQEILPP